MHRHGIHGRKFGRKTDQRLALTRGLMCSLIRYQSITTTLARAKEIRRDMEKLISMAKKGGLHNRRLVIKKLNDLEATKILFDIIAPQVKRDSGYRARTSAPAPSLQQRQLRIWMLPGVSL